MKASGSLRKLPVEFKSVGVNKETVRISLGVSRGDIDLDAFDELVTNAQLSAKLICDPNSKKDVAGQETLVEGDLSVEMIADSRGFTTRNDRFAVSLQTNKDTISVDRLGRFVGAKGSIECIRTGNAVALADADDDGEDED